MALQITTPLQWPDHQPRTPRGRQSMLHGFPPSLTIEDAIRYLDDEILPFNPVSATLATHIEQLSSPRLRKLENVSPAASVMIKMPEQNYLFACDRWLRPQDNIYAIVLTLRQIRTLDGYGVVTGDALFDLFAPQKAAPVQMTASANNSDVSLQPWHHHLGLGPTANLQDANAVYRARARTIGESNPTELSSLNDAIEQARRYFGE